MTVRMKGGKVYKTVQERLAAAHGDSGAPEGITSIITEPIAVGAATAIRATVTFADGRVFTGLSIVPFDATSGAEASNPIEVAETSSVGRALAFAGFYGSDDGIAGAEEMRSAQQRQAPVPTNAGVAPTRQGGSSTDAAPITAAVKQTPRAYYDFLVALAVDHQLGQEPEVVTLAPDAPDDHIVEKGMALKARLVRAGVLDAKGRVVQRAG